MCGESPTLPPAPEYAVLFLDLVWPEWKVDRDGTFLGNATGCLEELTAGVRLLRFTMVESVVEFVFSVDEVFSYSVVDRRGIRPALGPTVREPLLGSNLPLVVLVVRGFAGLEIDELSAEVIGLVMLDAGLWFCAASLAVFSLMVAESIVFCRLKLLLVRFHPHSMPAGSVLYWTPIYSGGLRGASGSAPASCRPWRPRCRRYYVATVTTRTGTRRTPGPCSFFREVDKWRIHHRIG